MNMVKRGRGRPPLALDVRRYHRVNLALTNEVYARASDRAKLLGMTLTTYCHDVLLKELYKSTAVA